jgi:hypothetical protein
MIQSSILICLAQTGASKSGQSSIQKLTLIGECYPAGEQKVPRVDAGNLLHMEREICVEK